MRWAISSGRSSITRCPVVGEDIDVDGSGNVLGGAAPPTGVRSGVRRVASAVGDDPLACPLTGADLTPANLSLG
jgi:hypothetical protein